MVSEDKLVITPEVGFSPHLGVLVSTLEWCREKTIDWVKDLTIYQLDYLYDENANSIGALLLHIASLEAAYQEMTFYGRNILNNPERIQKWRVPMYLGDQARREIKGHSVSYYLEELKAIRDQTVEQFRQYDDDWLWQVSSYGSRGQAANNYWMWYHVYEDEINHRGEISWLKSRIPSRSPADAS